MNQIYMDEYFVEQIEEDQPYIYGRVTVDHGTQWLVQTTSGTVAATITGKFRLQSEVIPVIGDWVAMTVHNENKDGLIHKVLDRKTEFSRKAAGNRTERQVQGANFDSVFIVMALNSDFNVRKLERFVLAAWDTGAIPVVVLTKSDLCDDLSEKLAEAYEAAPGVEVVAISALEGTGLDALASYLEPGKTIALFGASGVGKSTLVNRLAGKEMMKVNRVRQGDDRGTHTTTHREIVSLENGIMLMDTPGMRELGIWDDGSGVDRTFSDIAELVSMCRFNDCHHGNEPGCAVRAALASGELDDERYQSYLKLQKEARFIEMKHNQSLQLAERKRWKQISKGIRKKRKY